MCAFGSNYINPAAWLERKSRCSGRLLYRAEASVCRGDAAKNPRAGKDPLTATRGGRGNFASGWWVGWLRDFHLASRRAYK